MSCVLILASDWVTSKKQENIKEKIKKKKTLALLHVSFPSPYFPSLGLVWPLFSGPIKKEPRMCCTLRDAIFKSEK